jgi:hypothetical protein
VVYRLPFCSSWFPHGNQKKSRVGWANVVCPPFAAIDIIPVMEVRCFDEDLAKTYTICNALTISPTSDWKHVLTHAQRFLDELGCLTLIRHTEVK